MRFWSLWRAGSPLVVTALACLLGCEAPPPIDFSGPTADWPDYGGTKEGQRYSPLTQITRQNVRQLEVAWSYHSGDFSDGQGAIRSVSAFEATPIVVDDTLYVCTPFNRVIALDPETGDERWTYDPEIDPTGRYANKLVCRGVSTWLDPGRKEGAACRRRIFTATNDARLIALDGATGKPCRDFGEAGEVDLKKGVGSILFVGEYQVTSPEADYVLGTPNVWAPMSVDEERDLLFAPTGNSSPDWYGGQREGLDHYASSIVALRGSTGEVVWSFQTVHHDLWDYDVPAQPTLTVVKRDGSEIPAVVQPTKMGHLFVLHRETGEPLFPVEERPVPQGGVPGEKLSPTQPFPTKPPPLVPSKLNPDEAWGLTPWDRRACRKRLEPLRSEGIFTPPSLRGTVLYPAYSGGSNWGGVAVDPERQLVIANLNNMAFSAKLYTREESERILRETPTVYFGQQTGTPYAMRGERLFSPLGVPCSPPPWGLLTGIDLVSGEIAWSDPFGTIRDLTPLPIPIRLGVPNLGGPLVTASGLVFIGAAVDDYLRAYETETGAELWKARLPAGGQATPMTYRLGRDAKQYVVIAAGGHEWAGTKLGGEIVAFALP